MNARFKPREERALTRREVIVLVAVTAVLAMVLWPTLSQYRHSRRIRCVSNFKNIGLALRIFSTDHEGRFQWQLSGTNGTKDLLRDPYEAWRHFAFISNELSSPKIVRCPTDSERVTASDFSAFGPNNLSYFLGLLADDEEPKNLLGGDRNLTTNGFEVGPGLLLLGAKQTAGFTKKLHGDAGNILMADGSVQQVSSLRLQEAVVDAAEATTNTINRLLIP